jgi:hypothetical protein
LWRSSWNVDWQEKPKFSDKTHPSATFVPSQNPTLPDPGLNPGRRGGKPAINRLSYGAAYSFTLVRSHLLFLCYFSLILFLFSQGMLISRSSSAKFKFFTSYVS